MTASELLQILASDPFSSDHEKCAEAGYLSDHFQ